MRESLRDPVRLDHILECIIRINKYMDGKSLKDLQDDSLLFFAITKNFEIIGEAAYKLTNEFRNSHTSTPWDKIIKMRHILVHGYYKVNAEFMFEAYTNDLKSLNTQIREYLQELTDD